MLDRSSAIAKLLIVVFKELILLLKDCDIFCFLPLRTLWMMGDGVDRLTHRNSWVEEKWGFLWNLMHALLLPLHLTLRR